jgi:hypothetical protein
MLTGPAALRASEILGARIPPEHISEIANTVIQNPTDGNLALLGMLFPFAAEELREIQRLRDHLIHNELSETAVTSKQAPSSVPFLAEMKQLWQGLVDAKEYKPQDIRDYLESCLTICGTGSDPGCYPGLLMTLGCGYRLARLNLGLTHAVVRERLGISLNMLRNLEWGHETVHLHEKIGQYLVMLFPSGAHHKRQAIELILSSPECCIDFFERIKKLPHLGISPPALRGFN